MHIQKCTYTYNFSLMLRDRRLTKRGEQREGKEKGGGKGGERGGGGEERGERGDQRGRRWERGETKEKKGLCLFSEQTT